jgi:lipopolysaccharide export system permease protein
MAAVPAPQNRRFRLPRLSRYLLGQLLGPVAMLTFLITSVVWLSQSLPMLDLVINRGQSALTFIYLVFLMLPGLLMVILPIAFFFGTLLTLQRLQADSELVVMGSCGFSLRQLATPVLIAAAIVMAITYACALYLMPAGQSALASKVVDIRADIGAALLNEGEFNTPARGLTVFIRQMNSDGQINGILVHDSRQPDKPITYLAQKGVIAQTPAGTRLILMDGKLEQSAARGAQLSVLAFKRDTIDLDQFAGPAHAAARKTSELYLSELLRPQGPGLTAQVRNAYFSEANNRLSAPLYCLAFAMIALAAILRGRRQRGPIAVRLGLASLAAVGLRIAGYGVQGLAQNHPPLALLYYAIPLIGLLGGLLVLMGLSPAAILARRQRMAAA